MAAIVLVGDDDATAAWAATLAVAGHRVETCANVLAFQYRFSDEPADILVIDIAHADRGEAMLIPQVCAKWPACRVIAVVNDDSFSRSEFYRMGLWSPDEVLMKPVSGEELGRRIHTDAVARLGLSERNALLPAFTGL